MKIVQHPQLSEKCKVNMRYDYTPFRTVKIKNSDNTEYWQGYRMRKLDSSPLVGMQYEKQLISLKIKISLNIRYHITYIPLHKCQCINPQNKHIHTNSCRLILRLFTYLHNQYSNVLQQMNGQTNYGTSIPWIKRVPRKIK